MRVWNEVCGEEPLLQTSGLSDNGAPCEALELATAAWGATVNEKWSVFSCWLTFRPQAQGGLYADGLGL